MEKIDDALDAEWLNPDDLVEMGDEEAPRVSHVRALRPSPGSAPEADGEDHAGSASRDESTRLESPAHTVAALARLLFFFVIGVGLGSIFALGVATALELRRDPPETAPQTIELGRGALDSSGSMPSFGEPGPAL